MSKDLHADCLGLNADALVLDVLVLVVVIGKTTIISTQTSVVSASCTRAGLQWERPSYRDGHCYKGDSLTGSLPALTRRRSNILVVS